MFRVLVKKLSHLCCLFLFTII